MEGKKTSISLSTFILTLIIVILLFLLFGMWYYYNVIEENKNDESEVGKQLSELANNVNNGVNTVSNTNSNSVSQNKNDEVTLSGEYVIDLNSFTYTADDAYLEETYGDISFVFDEGNVDFEPGWGTYGKGTYTIENNKVVCQITDWVSEAGGYFEFKTEPVEFAFEIKDDNTLVVEESSKKGNVSEVIKDESGTFGMKPVDYSDYDCFAKGAKFVKE